MRLWHKDLLPYLPMQQTIAQWRECCAITSKLAKDHTPDHSLVNKLLDYDPAHFDTYVTMVLEQFNVRGYSISDKALKDYGQNYRAWVNYLKAELPWRVDSNIVIPKEQVFDGWHNKRYLRQCYYNLEEKFDCGAIPEKEWDRVINGYVILGGPMA